jgi:hypothetical protein
MQNLEHLDKAMQMDKVLKRIKMKLVGLQSSDTLKLKFRNAQVEKCQTQYPHERNFPQLYSSVYTVQLAELVHYHTSWMTDKSRFDS